MTCIFVAGTDTDVGKTLVSTALLYRVAAAGIQSLAMKPVAAGAEMTTAGWRNEDAQQLHAHITVSDVAYEQLNPVCLAPPVAPHLAAEDVGETLSVAQLTAAFNQLRDHYTHDLMIVEGAGGWLVPLNDHETLADFACAIKPKVILVVGLKLGCLNHTLLTLADMQQRGIEVVGWVANQVTAEGMLLQAENLAWLKRRLAPPLLATLPYLPEASAAAAAAYLPASHELMSVLQGN